MARAFALTNGQMVNARSVGGRIERVEDEPRVGARRSCRRCCATVRPAWSSMKASSDPAWPHALQARPRAARQRELFGQDARRAFVRARDLHGGRLQHGDRPPGRRRRGSARCRRSTSSNRCRRAADHAQHVERPSRCRSLPEIALTGALAIIAGQRHLLDVTVAAQALHRLSRAAPARSCTPSISPPASWRPREGGLALAARRIVEGARQPERQAPRRRRRQAPCRPAPAASAAGRTSLRRTPRGGACGGSPLRQGRPASAANEAMAQSSLVSVTMLHDRRSTPAPGSPTIWPMALDELDLGGGVGRFAELSPSAAGNENRCRSRRRGCAAPGSRTAPRPPARVRGRRPDIGADMNHFWPVMR